MKSLLTHIIVVCVICTLLTTVTHAYWVRTSYVPDGSPYNGASVGPVPERPDAAWESTGTAYGSVGYAFASISTRAGRDGYWSWIEPYTGTYFSGDCQSETSGSAPNVWGTDNRVYTWFGGGLPGVCDAFRVHRRLKIRSDVWGDADNLSLTSGRAVIDVDASAHVTVNTGTGGSTASGHIEYDMNVDHSEDSSWNPTFKLSKDGVEVQVDWDDIVGWLDDDFREYGDEHQDFVESFTGVQSLGIDATAYVHVDEVKSSNNATRADVFMEADSGFLPTDTGFTGP